MDIAKVKASKTDRLNVKMFLKDKENCWITNLTATPDGRLLVVDFYNKKIKVFGSKTASAMSFVAASNEVRDIATINETEAVVTRGCEQKLDILDITDMKPFVKKTIQLQFDAMCVVVCQETFIVTCPNTSPPSVKKVDRNGEVLWSCSDERLSDLWYICRNNNCTRVYLSGRESHSVAMISTESGIVERSRKVEGKHPRGLCTDKFGNVYVVYQNGVGILTHDLSQEKVLLSEADGIDGAPEAIAYDEEHNKLLLSYSFLQKNCNSVDSIQLS